MGAAPPTKYARTPDGVDLAYRVFEGGPADLVCVNPYVNMMEVAWEWPGFRRFIEGLASFARVVDFDGRGTGTSGRSGHPPTLEVRMRDLAVVMDAVRLDRAALFAFGDGAAVASLFAAAYPERVSALALFFPAVRTAWAADYPWGVRPEQAAGFQSQIDEHWGNEEASAEFLADAHGDLGPLAEDPAFRRFAAKAQRNALTPAELEAFDRVWMDTDVRDILPSIQAPTVVLHRAESEEDRGLHAMIQGAIPAATRTQLPGTEFIPWIGDIDSIVDAVAAHLGVQRPAGQYDRVLASVLFTDIVGSTQRAAELGDARWREVIVEHEARAREVLARHRGIFENTTGDGLMARFDGPARAVRCAQEIGAALQDLGIRIRAGVHTGEIELTEAGPHGLAVHLAARVAALAGQDEVWVSSTVKDLVAGSGLTFEDTGEHELKGIPDRWHLYRVVG